MNRLAAHAIAGLGAIWLICPAFGSDPPKPAAAQKTTKVQPGKSLGVSRIITFDINVALASAGPAGDLCPGASTPSGKHWKWTVKNTGTAPSKPMELVISCFVTGGNSIGWSEEKKTNYERDHCGCMRRTFQIPALPPGGSDTHKTFEGPHDLLSCYGPNPHVSAAAKLPGRTEFFQLCTEAGGSATGQ